VALEPHRLRPVVACLVRQPLRWALVRQLRPGVACLVHRLRPLPLAVEDLVRQLLRPVVACLEHKLRPRLGPQLHRAEACLVVPPRLPLEHHQPVVVCLEHRLRPQHPLAPLPLEALVRPPLRGALAHLLPRQEDSLGRPVLRQLLGPLEPLLRLAVACLEHRLQRRMVPRHPLVPQRRLVALVLLRRLLMVRLHPWAMDLGVRPQPRYTEDTVLLSNNNSSKDLRSSTASTPCQSM
jgi:hypothetical protein